MRTFLRLLSLLTSASAACGLSGCGTLFCPEVTNENTQSAYRAFTVVDGQDLTGLTLGDDLPNTAPAVGFVVFAAPGGERITVHDLTLVVDQSAVFGAPFAKLGAVEADLLRSEDFEAYEAGTLSAAALANASPIALGVGVLSGDAALGPRELRLAEGSEQYAERFGQATWIVVRLRFQIPGDADAQRDAVTFGASAGFPGGEPQIRVRKTVSFECD